MQDNPGIDQLTRRAAAALETLKHKAIQLRQRSYPQAGEGPEWLEPVLVRGLWGRVGSTLMMQLLGTSDEVSFDRNYPCENRCLGSLMRYLEPLSGRVTEPKGYWMDDPEHLWWVDPDSFNYDLKGIPLDYAEVGVDRAVLHREAVAGAWRAYSRAATRPGAVRPRFYAEKYAGYAPALADAGIAYRWVDLVRDPRDVWCSVLAFDRKRGFFGFGRRETQSEDAYLASFLLAVRRRLDEMATPDGAPALTVRYEDLVAALDAEAARIGAWLGVTLDAAAAIAASAGLEGHRTAASTDASIGRWRQDLSAETVGRIEAELGEHFERFGYALS